MALALFDLDNTILNGDSDHAWGIYLADIGAVDPIEQKSKQDYFYQQYRSGNLNIVEFCEFQFQVLSQNTIQQLEIWRNDFLRTVITPMIDSGKPELLAPHRAKGDDILIITATNDFITRPIAEMLGVETLLATEAEFSNGAYTGKVAGTPCFQNGKVKRLDQWRRKNNKGLENSSFYSDSINDLPLLEKVDNPIVVTPDERLRAHAQKFHWPIIE